MKVAILFAILIANAISVGQKAIRTVAVTIDDLPVVSTRRDLKNR